MEDRRETEEKQKEDRRKIKGRQRETEGRQKEDRRKIEG